MKQKAMPEIVLPAIRGIMGDWVFYSCLMSLRELSTRVDYAREIHSHEGLSDMIQRQLDGKRGKEIADYLRTQPQRFFNSLVVATYGGNPIWHALKDVRNRMQNNELANLNQEVIESVGFLTLTGKERLFALDGQHRLAGIKKAINDKFERPDEVSVIFVAHNDTDQGLERTRRLFTTLNKTARPVLKGDIIALDEDDVMAICVRRLIEETDLFGEDRIAFVATNNMPTTNKTSLTTIGNLYDVLTILFTKFKSNLKRRKGDLQRIRPEEEELDKYFNYSKSYFYLLGENFDELGEFFAALETRAVVSKYRGSHGGKALFRPLGLEIFTRILARLTNDMSLRQAIELASKLPRDLDIAPFAGLMWDTSSKTILAGHKVTLREVLCYMIGINTPDFSEDVLLNRYRRDTGNESVCLPRKLT